ncbi:MAG: rhomboid family intramembrane serine protease [Hyphomonadaceae bacterium]
MASPHYAPPRPAIHLVLGAAIVGVTVFELTASSGVIEALIREYGVVPLRFTEGPGLMPSSGAALSLVAHAFLHGGWLHLGMNMFVYFQIAGLLAWRLSERGAGALRFLAFFAGSAASGAIAYILINPHADSPAVGASGAICGLFAGYLLGARRNWRDALRDPQIRNAALWFLAINVGLMFFIAQGGVFPIAWEAHLGGFLGGLALFPLLAPRRERYAGPWG